MSSQDATASGAWSTYQQKPPFPLFTFYRAFPLHGDSVDALVFIYRHPSGYEVRSRVAAPRADPDDTSEGHRPTLDEAIALAAEVRGRLDERYG